MLHLLPRDLLLYILESYLPACYYIWILRLVCTSLNRKLRGIRIEEDIKLYLSERREFLIYTGYGMMSDKIKKEIDDRSDIYFSEAKSGLHRVEYLQLPIWTGYMNSLKKNIKDVCACYYLSLKDARRFLYFYLENLSKERIESILFKNYYMVDEDIISEMHRICDKLYPSNTYNMLRHSLILAKEIWIEHSYEHYIAFIDTSRFYRKDIKIRYDNSDWSIETICERENCIYSSAIHTHFYRLE